jgi:hypothetical protein
MIASLSSTPVVSLIPPQAPSILFALPSDPNASLQSVGRLHSNQNDGDERRRSVKEIVGGRESV